MICEKCRIREANIKYTEVIGGVKTEHNLCSQCAQEMDFGQYSAIFDGEFPLGKLLSGLLGLSSPASRPQKAEEVVRELSRQRAEEAVGELSRQGAEEAVGELSRQRVRERCAAGSFPAVVIGADTVVAVEGRILGKPDSKEEAVRMITLLQGRAHQVYTGVTMIFRKDGECLTFAERTDVHVCPMSQEQVIAYVETKEPMDKAGAYGIQGRFAVYIQGIEGDYNNVVGLPLGRVCRELMKRGFQIF